ncbi:MAG: mechanosensitive ion channel family protein [Eubacteriales bacterium]
METFINNLVSWCTSFGFKLIAALVILIVGWILTGKLVKLIRSAKKMNELDHTAANFISNAIGIVVKIILVVIAISLMGVPMASVVTVLATSAAAIGLALQGGLSNIAGGILIMIFKPFKLGDFVISDGESGTVTDINIFYTTLLTPDNKTIRLPNGTVAGGKVTNLSTQPVRRVDFEFIVEYGTNTNGVTALLKTIGEKHEKVLSDPSVTAMIGGYNEKGISVYLRVWCKGADYWDVFFDINKIVKEEFERYDVKFAVPQLDVHVDGNEK